MCSSTFSGYTRDKSETTTQVKDMSDPSDVDRTKDPATGLIQIGWPGGILTLRYTGIPAVTEEARDEIQNIMQQFSADCQMMLIWFVGVLNSRGAIQRRLDVLAQREEPLTINSLRPDGRVESVFARMPAAKVIEAFSDAGAFERLYAKAFVVFTFQIWEEVARPKIATALKVEPEHIDAKLMGDWRHLRNWLVHRTKKAERDYFDKAGMLVRLLGSQPNEPSLTAYRVFILMQHLNRMSVEVNPHSVEFGIEPVPLDPATIAEIGKTLEPGEGMVVPVEAGMYPSGVFLLWDGTTAVIHERDCSHKDTQFENIASVRSLLVNSRKVAGAVVEHLGKQEYRCEYCRPSEG